MRGGTRMKNLVAIAQLVRTCGTIEGRVKLQKIVHILQQVGHPFKEEFGYLHHGPYSSELKREINQLVNWSLVTEQEIQIKDYTQFSYSADDKLDELLADLDAHDEPEWAKLAKELNGKTSRDLEGISTIMFLRRRGFAGERLQQRFAKLKPNLENRFDAYLGEAEALQKLDYGGA